MAHGWLRGSASGATRGAKANQTQSPSLIQLCRKPAQPCLGLLGQKLSSEAEVILGGVSQWKSWGRWRRLRRQSHFPA